MNVSNCTVTWWSLRSQKIAPYLLTLGIADGFLLFLILAGNILTICAVKISHKLSGVLSNQFVLSLAVSDIMVAITFPYHYMFYILENLSTTRILCLLRFVFISFALSSSVNNILGIAVDRYVAIIYPLHYTRYMTKKVATVIMTSNWTIALSVSVIPLVWNVWEENKECSLHHVLASGFLQLTITPMFVSIWITMLIIYIRIWKEASGHAKRLMKSTSLQYGKVFYDTKSVQVLLLIMGCFSICWLPYFITVIVFKVNSLLLYEVTFHMAIANSCMNPVIYAWKNKKFRKIFWCLLRFKTPNNRHYNSSFITNYISRVKTAKLSNNSEYATKQSYVHSKFQYDNKTDEENSINTLSSIGSASVQ